MSEKVILTKEQAAGVECIKNTIIKNIEELTVSPHRYYEEQRPLSELEVDVIVDAVFEGYEVEETFEFGDWVKNKIGEIGRVIEVKETILWADWGDGGPSQWVDINEAKHATPEEIAEEKQRRWWAEHGRGVGELKINDVLLRNDGAYVSVFHVDESQEKYELVARGAYRDRYKVDKEIIKAFYKVICFAEDRKDVQR